MNRLALSVLVLSGLVTSLVRAQQNNLPAKTANAIDRPAEPGLVFDEDGGKVQIVPPDVTLSWEKKFHRGDVMKSVQQTSIFLGAAWGDQKVRSRETALVDLASTEKLPLEELKKNSFRVLAAAPGIDDFTDLTKAQVNDLTIQRKLSDLLANKAIPIPNPSTVYVVYLAPGISSSLGAQKAGVDYAAYHNWVHLDAGEVRYVVVPFQDNTDRQAAAAARALVETALNPNGTGWY
jgi:hypothetical protein